MTKKQSQLPVIFVSGILEKMDGNERKIFLQTRWKPTISPLYSGLLEIPGGRVEDGEDIFKAIKREVKEECGLKIIKFRNTFQGKLHTVSTSDKAVIFQPFTCQQVFSKDNGKLWFGFVFICEVKGKPKMQKGETKDPQWVSIPELTKLVCKQPEKFFPHQLEILKYYLESIRGN